MNHPTVPHSVPPADTLLRRIPLPRVSAHTQYAVAVIDPNEKLAA